eukprot:COSAG02_NODE_7948_length_2775_cov_2.871076_1_plen_49_part_00
MGQRRHRWLLPQDWASLLLLLLLLLLLRHRQGQGPPGWCRRWRLRLPH